MSLKVLTKEIERFIRTTEPQVLCLKGGWGVGKTFLWNNSLKNAEDDCSVGLNPLGTGEFIGSDGSARLQELP
jgi:hypothetical protein